MTYQRKEKTLRRCKFRLCGKEYLSQYPNSEYCCSSHRQKERWQREHLSDVEKVQCLDCGGWFVKLGSHVILSHGYKSAKEYRIAHGLDYKRGIVPDWHRKILGENVRENGTIANLDKGAHQRFKKGGRSSEIVSAYWEYRREHGKI